MKQKIKDFIVTCESEIDNNNWDELLRFAHEDALLNNQDLDTVILILESTLDIDLYQYQCDAFLRKLKDVIAAGNPAQSSGYRNMYGAIKLRSWLLGPYWRNLYGLSLDDAINVCVDNFNVEETPDEGTLMWIE